MAGVGMPTGAGIAIADMLDKCAEVKPGMEVVILAEVDGLYGGDSPVDEAAMSWIQAGVAARGARHVSRDGEGGGELPQFAAVEAGGTAERL